MQNMKGKKVE